MNAKTEDIDFNILSIYAPIEARQRKDFFGKIESYTTDTQYTIVAGDFNCVKDINMDKQGGNSLRGY